MTGMYDPVSAYGTTEEMWFNEWEFRRPEDFPKGWDGFTAQGKETGQAMRRALALSESAGGAGPVPEVVADAAHQGCEDADAGDPFAARLSAGCLAGVRAVYGAAAAWMCRADSSTSRMRATGC